MRGPSPWWLLPCPMLFERTPGASSALGAASLRGSEHWGGNQGPCLRSFFLIFLIKTLLTVLPLNWFRLGASPRLAFDFPQEQVDGASQNKQ